MSYSAEILKLLSLGAFIIAALMLLHRFLRQTGVLKPYPLTSSSRNERVRSNWLKRLRGFFQQDSWKLLFTISLLVVFTRFFIHIVGWLGYMLTEDKPIGLFDSFQFLWNRWDGPHYLHIAENGYVNHGDEKNFLVFFPFYPLLIRAFHFIIPDWFWAGVIVSNISLVIACLYLYKLVTLDYGEKTGFNAVKYLLFFPVSFFLGIPFSESLFLALSLMTLYYSRMKNWAAAGICGMLSALTRSLGILLVIPFVVEFLTAYNILKPVRQEKTKTVVRRLGRHFAAVFLIPAGSFLYLCINKSVSGEWFKFLEYQKEHWDQSFGFFAQNIKKYLHYSAVSTPSSRASLWIPQLVIILFTISLLIYGIRKLPLSYSAYFFVYLLVSISPTWLLSGPRYIMSAFPVFILLALLAKNKTMDSVLTYTSLTSLGFCALAFATGHYIM